MDLKESKKILGGRFLSPVLGMQIQIMQTFVSLSITRPWGASHPRVQTHSCGGYQREILEEVLPINRARLSHCKRSTPQIRTLVFYFILLYVSYTFTFPLSFMNFTFSILSLFSLLVSAHILLYQIIPLSFPFSLEFKRVFFVVIGWKFNKILLIALHLYPTLGFGIILGLILANCFLWVTWEPISKEQISLPKVIVWLLESKALAS